MTPQSEPENVSDLFFSSASNEQFILTAPCDVAAIQAMALPVTALVVNSSGQLEAKGNLAGLISLEEVRTKLLGCISASAEGYKILAAACVAWKEQFDDFAPPIALRPAADRTEALEWLVSRTLEDRRSAAVRASRLMRELGIMRRQHEETQASFRNLEAFFHQSAKSLRSPDLILSPVAGQRPLTLVKGSRFEQRLPGSSIGLSDIALHVVAGRPSRGLLHVSLTSPDSGELLATWNVEAAKLTAGWLRLSVERTLGSQPVTIVMTLNYEGPDRIQLSNSVQHPEPRFQPRYGGEAVPSVLALQMWRWIAGVEVPLAAGAVLTVGTRDGLRRVHAQALTTSYDLNNPKVHMGLQPDTDALLVHVLEDRVAGAVLSGIAQPGARHIYADVRTCHCNAPEVEYRIALAPRMVAMRAPGMLPDFATDHASDWIRLSAMDEGQVHLFLPEPLDQPCDIYLLTRLPEEGRSNAYGWSTFANLSLQY